MHPYRPARRQIGTVQGIGCTPFAPKRARGAGRWPAADRVLWTARGHEGNLWTSGRVVHRRVPDAPQEEAPCDGACEDDDRVPLTGEADVRVRRAADVHPQRGGVDGLDRDEPEVGAPRDAGEDREGEDPQGRLHRHGGPTHCKQHRVVCCRWGWGWAVPAIWPPWQCCCRRPPRARTAARPMPPLPCYWRNIRQGVRTRYAFQPARGRCADHTCAARGRDHSGIQGGLPRPLYSG